MGETRCLTWWCAAGRWYIHFGNDKFDAGKLTMPRLADALVLDFSPEDYRAS
jgi:hypothetical protein